MKYILASNILEHPGFFDFVKQMTQRYPDCPFLLNGDLLNIFPEPGEDLRGSIFYTLYGEMLVTEMDHLVKTRFKNLDQSSFIKPLQQMFLPLGEHSEAAENMAEVRYQNFFSQLNQALGSTPLYSIPGNMDYPRLMTLMENSYPSIHVLDCQVKTVDGVRIAGIGGNPNTVHPFGGIVEISPYEMTEAEYERRLAMLHGVDVLLTHVSPYEYPPLMNFIKQSPLRLLICRAPFNLKRDSNFRGKLEIDTLAAEGQPEKSIIKVRPFDFPVNEAFLIDLSLPHIFNPAHVEILLWEADKPSDKLHSSLIPTL